MPLTQPETVKSQGNTTLIVLTTPPAVVTAPTLAELNAGEFITVHVYGDFGATPTQNVGSAPRKMGSRVEPQQLGNITYTINDISYSYVPQLTPTPSSPGNEAFEALTEGTEVYLVEGPGIDGLTSALATDDVVNIYHVECGVQRRGRTGDGEFDEFNVQQSFVMVDGAEPQYDYEVPAA